MGSRGDCKKGQTKTGILSFKHPNSTLGRILKEQKYQVKEKWSKLISLRQ